MSTPTVHDIVNARYTIRPHVRQTPLVESGALSERTRATVLLKLETLQVTGSFKIRGAVHALKRFAHQCQLRGEPARVVTASAGNHGRAIAHAARILGVEATIFTPRTAPRAKTAPIIASGARLVTDPPTYDDAERMAREYGAAAGVPYISPYNHPDVIAGAGTVGLELVEARPDLVLVPIGGGGLAAGVAIALKSLTPRTRVVGVEVAANPCFTKSLQAGRIVTIEPGPTVADGLSGNLDEGSITFGLVRSHVDEVVTVEEAAVLEAIRALMEHERIVSEGAGAVGVAALLSGAVTAADRRVGVIVSGANIDVARLCAIAGAGGDTPPPTGGAGAPA